MPRPSLNFLLRIAAPLCVLASGWVAVWAQDEAADDASTDRLPPRAEVSDDEAAALADELRRQYAKPPAEWPAPEIDPGVAFVELGPAPPAEFPAENPFSEPKRDLGQMLFFDARLSGSGQIACASCHDPDLDWADGRTVSFGHARTTLARNAPSLLHGGHATSLFWDGRAPSLEALTLEVIANNEEMRGDIEAIAARLGEVPGYRDAFAEAFGSPGLTPARIAQAVATFVRTLVGGRSDFDKFLSGAGGGAGGDEAKLSDEAVRGLHLFRTTARCANCHHGPLLTDGKFHDLGLSYYGRKYEDLGRYEVTRDPADVGRFRTPTLRNVTRTRPYMHLGLFDLEGVLRMYNAGMATLRRKPDQADDPLFPTKSPHLRSLGLNRRDLADLKAFLEALEEPRRRIRAPELPE